jgi:hypothetical protein
MLFRYLNLPICSSGTRAPGESWLRMIAAVVAAP